MNKIFYTNGNMHNVNKGQIDRQTDGSGKATYFNNIAQPIKKGSSFFNEQFKFKFIMFII